MRLRNVHLRRIQWALETPSFLDLDITAEYYYHPGHKEKVHAILQELDQDPESLNHYFESLGYMPLGRYFEQLLFFILDRDPYYEVLWANQQIVNELGITEGEIDLVIQKVGGEIEHWEIALKYYLQVQASTDHNFYLGPSRKDFLAKKMAKLYEHQLKLGKHTQVVSKFGSIPSKLFLKGELYYPKSSSLYRPQSYQEQAKVYHHIKFEDLAEMQERSHYFKILFKPDWLGPYQTEDPSILRNFREVKIELKEEFSHLYRPQLLALIRIESEQYVEFERYFILPKDWPAEPKA